jgi:hypothetical protein
MHRSTCNTDVIATRKSICEIVFDGCYAWINDISYVHLNVELWVNTIDYFITTSTEIVKERGT